MPHLLSQVGASERVLLAAGVYCAIGRTIDGLEAVPPAPADWAGLLASAARHKLGPMLHVYARDHGWEVAPRLQWLSHVYGCTTAALFAELSPVLERVQCEGVDAMLLKGGDLALFSYPQPPCRIMDDLDLLIATPHLPLVRAAFADAGFDHGHFNRAHLRIEPLRPGEYDEIVARHYELPALMKIRALPELAPLADQIRESLDHYTLTVLGSNVFFVTEYDVHFNLAPDFELQDIWHAPRSISLPDGRPMLAQSFTDLLWFLSARMYHEIMMLNQVTLRQFIDVLAVAARWHDAIDWKRICAMADKYDLHPSLYYVFWHINELLGQVIPAHVIEHCSPANEHVKRFHDWGDFLPKMLGASVVEPLLPETAIATQTGSLDEHS